MTVGSIPREDARRAWDEWDRPAGRLVDDDDDRDDDDHDDHDLYGRLVSLVSLVSLVVVASLSSSLSSSSSRARIGAYLSLVRVDDEEEGDEREGYVRR